MALVRATWHPTLTVYRLSLITLTTALSTAKVFTTSAASVTIDWVIGIVVFLLVFFLSYYDSDENANPRWLFRTGALEGLQTATRLILRKFASLNDQAAEPAQPPRIRRRLRTPKLTVYRSLITLAAIGFGTSKLYLSLIGEETAPKALEWVYGVVVTLGLYWLGLYEYSPNGPIPWLFTEDCAPLARAMAKLLIGAGTMFLILWGIRSGIYLSIEWVMAIDWYMVLLAVLLIAMTVIGIVSPALFSYLDFLLWVVFSLIDPEGFRHF
ncbi:hypothetical protein FA13DRAFT_946670 [Coprinellus micaceus]|uniref:Uncharacterized protein n=1 Tax=Coprinellus micaceus TaxID=71717 RepID=A0A4Y7T145_COPMI|nr:hypothetical protein FA13DRAFT_946670 [Coprinellus micaceus]